MIVAEFDPGSMTAETPATQGWIRLAETDLYALPLNLEVTNYPPNRQHISVANKPHSK